MSSNEIESLIESGIIFWNCNERGKTELNGSNAIAGDTYAAYEGGILGSFGKFGCSGD